jgi:protein gp37
VRGCSRVSDGCTRCYAERIALKFKLTPKPWTKVNAPHNVQIQPHKLREPYRIKQPCRIFVNSMSDLFHELVPDEFLAKVFEVMNECLRHTFQILTKRPERAAAWPGPWSANIWMGTSVEDRRVIRRIETLRDCGARIKFVSYQPSDP